MSIKSIPDIFPASFEISANKDHVIDSAHQISKINISKRFKSKNKLSGIILDLQYLRFFASFVAFSTHYELLYAQKVHTNSIWII